MKEFADFLYEQGEFYRAITEYQRFRFYSPDTAEAETALYFIGLSYYRGEQYRDAIAALHSFRELYPDNPRYMGAFYISGRAALLLRDFEDSRSFFEQVQNSTDPLAPLAEAQVLLSYLLERNWDKADAMLRGKEGRIAFHPVWLPAYYEDAATYQDIPHKSPVIAGLLSAVLPGAGQAYCQRYRDMATAVVVNGLLIWGSLAALENDETYLAGVLGGIELLFYSGTIFSASSSARKYNRTREEQWLNHIQRNYPLSDISTPD